MLSPCHLPTSEDRMQVWATYALLIMVSEPLLLELPSLMSSVSVVKYVCMCLNRVMKALYGLKLDLVIFFIVLLKQAFGQPNLSQMK